MHDKTRIFLTNCRKMRYNRIDKMVKNGYNSLVSYDSFIKISQLICYSEKA